MSRKSRFPIGNPVAHALPPQPRGEVPTAAAVAPEIPAVTAAVRPAPRLGCCLVRRYNARGELIELSRV